MLTHRTGVELEIPSDRPTRSLLIAAVLHAAHTPNYQPSGDGRVRLSTGTLGGLARHEAVRVRRQQTCTELRLDTAQSNRGSGGPAGLRRLKGRAATAVRGR
eukprot:scaffold70628_cov71-Phaeocystis_antarctica.AAC.8